ncbi:hypothetical protein SBRCBS47491_006452 [Sporothrix bragantina]|uniref:Uncharacterized protein n=1 Tax=Sporothrix bragantina TaxID=671064 RepID=A0ABP0C4X3_9PEZI
MSRYIPPDRGPGQSSKSNNGRNNSRGNITNSCPSTFSYPVAPSNPSTPRKNNKGRHSLLPPTPQGVPVLHTADRHNTLRNPADYDRGYYDGIKYGRRNAQALLQNENDSAYAAGKQHGYQDGYSDGRREGHRAGRREGHRDGHREGHRDGYQDRFLRGHERGHKEGHTEGLSDGRVEGHKAGHATGRVEGHRLGFKKGYHEGYQNGVVKTYASSSATSLRGNVQEFVPGKPVVVSEPATTNPAPYVSPVVVDGSSGPSVSPTAYKTRRDAEERQQAMQAHGIYMPVSEDIVPNEMQHTAPSVGDQAGPIVKQQTDHSVDNQVIDQSTGQPVDESVTNPTAGQTHDESCGYLDQGVVQPKLTPGLETKYTINETERDTVEASQLDGQSVAEPKADTVTSNNSLQVFVKADLQASATPDQQADRHINEPLDDHAHNTPRDDQYENNGSDVQDDQTEQVQLSTSITEDAVANLPCDNDSQVANLSRSVSTGSLKSDATVEVHRLQKPSPKSDQKSSLYFFGSIPVAIPKLPWLPLSQTKSSPALTFMKDNKPAPIVIAQPCGEETQILPEPMAEEDAPTVILHYSEESDIDSDSPDDSASVQNEFIDTVADIPSPPAPNPGSETSSSDESPSESVTKENKDQPQSPEGPNTTIAKAKLQFDDIVIFRNYLPDPPLRSYPSVLFQSQPAFEIGPDQAPQITESYPIFRGRDRHPLATAYHFRWGQLSDPIVEVHDKNGIVFPVGGRTPPPGIHKVVPDHIVYKYGFAPPNHVSISDSNGSNSSTWGQPGAIGPERLGRCVQHGLSTCPMCAITPSFRFLGPGEAIARVLDYMARPCGDPQTNPTSFWRCRPMGFGDFDMNGVLFQEATIAEVQHPDESNPFLSSRFIPQYDPEILGHLVQDNPEDNHNRNKDKPLPPTSLDTFYCEQCDGITWLVTRRSRPAGGVGTHHHQRGHGGGDRTFGKAHPSHHASYNEAWSRSESYCSPGHRNRFPEQSGTTRSLFVQIAAVDLPKSQGAETPSQSNKGKKGENKKNPQRFGVAAYFGPDSRFNSRIDFDLATATMEVASVPLSVSHELEERGRERLLDMPFEVFTCNAGPIVALTLALYRLWTEVVPAHRSAIDRVTRYNSDHSRRKAYRFRAILMTESAYLVDLFSDQLRERWQRKFRTYQQNKGKKHQQHRKASSGDSSKTDAVAAAMTEKPVASGAADPKKKKNGNKNKKKKKKAKAAQTQAGNSRDILVKVTTSVTTEYLDVSDKDGNNGNNAGNKKIDADDDDSNIVDIMEIDVDGSSHSFSISTPTSSYPSPSRSPPRPPRLPLRPVGDLSSSTAMPSPGLPPPPPPPTPATLVSGPGLYAQLSQNGARDNLDFDRPDGRFMYCSPCGATLANSVLVHLAWRYMDLLRCHGVHVSFYHVDSEHIVGARSLARECEQ